MVQTLLRHEATQTKEDLRETIQAVGDFVSQDDAYGWFRHCLYGAPLDRYDAAARRTVLLRIMPDVIKPGAAAARPAAAALEPGRAARPRRAGLGQLGGRALPEGQRGAV